MPQQGQVLWWVLWISLVLSAMGVKSLHSSLLQWQLVQQSQSVMQALWLAETELQQMQTALRTNPNEPLEAPPEQPLMPQLPKFLDSPRWRSYQRETLENGWVLAQRAVPLGAACLDMEAPCVRYLYHTVVVFDGTGYRLLALRQQFRLQWEELGAPQVIPVSWEWL